MVTTQLKDLIQETLFSIPWQTKLQPTLPAQHVSVVLHEPAILSGYRVPYKPWKYYFFSMFQLHNETVNVWTHLIGCCVILHKLYGYFDEFNLSDDAVMKTLLIFGVSSLIGLLTSATVHLLHAKSPYVHFVAFMTDYMGATFCSFGSGIGCFYGMSENWIYHALDGVYLPALTLVSYANFINLCMAKIWYGHDPHNMNRKYMFIAGMGTQAIMNMTPFAVRYVTCYHDVTCSYWSLNHITVINIVFILQAVSFAAHQPESTWPGKFDIFGHGHQIFHVLIVINDVFQFDAIYSDHKNGVTSHAEPNMGLIFTIMAAMFVLDVVTLNFIRRCVPASLARVKEVEAMKSD